MQSMKKTSLNISSILLGAEQARIAKQNEITINDMNAEYRKAYAATYNKTLTIGA